MYIEEIRRIHEDCRYVFFYLFFKLRINLRPLAFFKSRASAVEKPIHGFVGVEGDIQTGIFSLRGKPKRKRVGFSADNFSEEKRIVFPGADDILLQIAGIKYP